MQEKSNGEGHFWALIIQRHPDYLRWFIADTASAFGSSVVAVPLTLVSYHFTESLSRAGLVGAASATGSMIMTIPAGMIIDRFDKKRLLLLNGVVQLVVWSCFSVLVALEAFSFWPLLLFSLFSGMFSGAFGGLTNAILRFIVPENLLVQARGRNQTRDNILWMAGLPLGGLLYGIFPALPFIVDALSGFGPLYASRSIRTRLRGNRFSAPYSFAEFWADTKYSTAWIWRYPKLRTIFGIDIFSNFANFFLIVAIDLWLASRGVDGWVIGLTSTMFTLGLIAGGFLQDRLLERFPGSRIIRAAMTWELIWYIFLICFADRWQLMAAAAFFIVIPSIARNSYSGSVLALSAPPEKIGKCSAGARLIMGLLPVVASAAAGSLLAAAGFQMSMALCATCSTFSCIIASSSILRSLPKAADLGTLPVCE